MLCENCKVDIPPAWVVVLAKNECPACGKEIMSSETKQLMIDLKEAMQKMPNDPEGLAGWLISNYHLQKIGSGEPTTFFRDKKIEHQSDNNPEIKVRTTENKNKSIFVKRSGVNIDNERMKKIVENIRNGSSSTDSFESEDAEDIGRDDANLDEELNQEDDLPPDFENLFDFQSENAIVPELEARIPAKGTFKRSV